MEWPIVVATRADAPGVIDLIRRVFLEYGWIWREVTEVPDLLRWAPHYEPPHGAFWVIRRDGHVVGSAGVDRPAPATAELHRLYLDPDLRGRGLGDALVQTVIGWCRAQGLPRLVLWSDTRFTHAHRLYLRHGFRRTGERTLAGDINDSREYGFERDV